MGACTGQGGVLGGQPGGGGGGREKGAGLARAWRHGRLACMEAWTAGMQMAWEAWVAGMLEGLPVAGGKGVWEERMLTEGLPGAGGGVRSGGPPWRNQEVRQ